jgi:hypothetical protein
MGRIWHQCGITPDGERFLDNTLIREEQFNAAPITVLVNWAAAP